MSDHQGDTRRLEVEAAADCDKCALFRGDGIVCLTCRDGSNRIEKTCGDCMSEPNIILDGVEVQPNGILRNAKGRIIAKSTDDAGYHTKHIQEGNVTSVVARTVFTCIDCNTQHPTTFIAAVNADNRPICGKCFDRYTSGGG